MKRRSFLKVVGGLTGGVATGVTSVFGKDAEPIVGKTQGMPQRVLGRTGIKVSVVGFAGLALSHYERFEQRRLVYSKKLYII